MKKLSLLFLFLFFNWLSISCQVPGWAWVESSHTSPTPKGIKTDQFGNIYVIGEFSGSQSMNFGNITIYNHDFSGNTRDFYLAKFRPSGSIIWAKSIGSSGDETMRPNSITLDGDCNIYFVGVLAGSIPWGNQSILLGGFFAKLDSSGNEKWGKNTSNLTSLTYNHNTGLYISSIFNTTFIVGNDTLIPYGWDTYVARIDTAGNFLKAMDIGNTTTAHICNDKDGNIYMFGLTDSSVLHFGDSIANLTNMSTCYPNGILVKLDSALNPKWARKVCSSASCNCVWHFNSLVTDNNDNIYITGCYTGDSIKTGTCTFWNSSGYYDIFVSKWDSAGNFCLASGYGGIRDDSPTSIAIDSYNNFYLSGQYESPSLVFGNFTLSNYPVTPSMPYYCYAQIFLVKFNSTGILQWATSIGGKGTNAWAIITSDFANNLYLTGSFYNDTFVLANDTLKTSGMFLAKMPQDSITQIDNISKPLFGNVFPNPSKGNFYIKIPREARKVQIFNTYGQMVKNYTSNNQETVNFYLPQEGIYYLKVVSEKEIITEKIVICK